MYACVHECTFVWTEHMFVSVFVCTETKINGFKKRYDPHLIRKRDERQCCSTMQHHLSIQWIFNFFFLPVILNLMMSKAFRICARRLNFFFTLLICLHWKWSWYCFNVNFEGCLISHSTHAEQPYSSNLVCS